MKLSCSETVESLLAKLTGANIVTLALRELPVLFGLVLFFVAGFRSDIFLLFGL